jgi:hypothetical protein
MPKINSSLLFRLKPSKNHKDITNRHYGKLIALGYLGHDARWQAYWRCICACGNMIAARYGNLQSGQTFSCGCSRRKPLTHGMSRTKVHSIWLAMKQRCKDPARLRYRGRGITYDPAWESFTQFYADMGTIPEGDYSIERRDNNGPYAPWNCYWARRDTQSRNKATNVWLEINGRRMIFKDWCSLAGLNRTTVESRIKRGMTPREALTTPTRYGFIPHSID